MVGPDARPVTREEIMLKSAKIVFPVLLGFLSLPVAALSQEIGKEAFQANCAVCHGTDGKGGGPILDYLKSAPSDLTRISERNGGQFPAQQVYDLIADAGQTRAHGTSEMPIWGNRFNAEIIAQQGEYGSGQTDMPSAQARILELVFFLATIQEAG
ncbi:c-type cytochrome [Mameliella alba]|nr:cytochrome c [Mameliella alba]